jgi:fucose 4-O-acetylase-like acetyltransferase
MPNPGLPSRLLEIDAAKGVAISLVVLGHIVARDYFPLGNNWWHAANFRLYSFHMAFFFFISGYVFFLTRPEDWGARTRKSVGRLVPSYLLLAVIVYVAKLIAVHVLPVDRKVGSLGDEVWLMLAYPTSGFASFLWFIITLLSLYALMALLATWIKHHFWMVLAVAFVLHVLSVTGNVTEFFAVHQLTRYWFFFLLGGLCLRHRDALLPRFRRNALWWTLLLVLVLLYVPERWLPTVAAGVAIPVLHGISANVYRAPTLDTALQWLGRNSFTIFLMNSLALGLARGIVLKVWSWDDWRFLIVAPILFICGLILPILAQRTIFSRWSYLDRITR